MSKRVAKSTGRALLEDYSVKKTQPHFYEDHVEKSKKNVNLLDIVGKPIELAVDLKQKSIDAAHAHMKKSAATSSAASSAAVSAVSSPVADVDELTSPLEAVGGDYAKLQLCDEVADELSAMKGSAFNESPLLADEATADSRRRDFCNAKRPSDTCLEPEY